MNCMNHPDRPAVTTCTQCATGMCPDCVANGISIDSKALCAQCAPGTLKKAIAELKSQRWRSKLKFFLSIGVVGVGLCYAAAIMLTDDPYKSTSAFFIILFSFGLADVISVLKREDANLGGHAFLIGAGRPDAALTSGCISLICALVLGMVVAPLNMYRYFTSFRTCEKRIREYEELLAPFNASASPAGK